MDSIVVTVHGVMKSSNKNWQYHFSKLFQDLYPHSEIINFDYRFLFAPISWLIMLGSYTFIPGPIRYYYIARFIRFIRVIDKSACGCPISIVAHSFGSWIVYWAMDRYPKLKIKNLVLVNSVLSIHGGKLKEWLEEGRIKRIYVWSSSADPVVCTYAIPPFGRMGCRGWLRPEAMEEDLICPKEQPYPDLQIYNIHFHKIIDHDDILANNGLIIQIANQLVKE